VRIRQAVETKAVR